MKGKIAHIDRPVYLRLSLPESLRAKLDLLLWSDYQGKVPFGAYTSFFTKVLSELFDKKRFDLEPLGFPAGSILVGTEESFDKLKDRLK